MAGTRVRSRWSSGNTRRPIKGGKEVLPAGEAKGKAGLP
jgi:hypothetical protein